MIGGITLLALVAITAVLSYGLAIWAVQAVWQARKSKPITLQCGILMLLGGIAGFIGMLGQGPFAVVAPANGVLWGCGGFLLYYEYLTKTRR